MSLFKNFFRNANPLLDDIRHHIEAKFSQAELIRLPFPHLVIEDFFPTDIYSSILEANPFRKNAGEEWFTKSKAPTKTPTPYWARTQINFHKDQSFQVSAEHRKFWGTIKSCFLDDYWFTQLVMEKYTEYFLLRFGEIATTHDFPKRLHRELFLQQHEPGFYIGPHTDVPGRIFTCIFSFADRTGFEEFGTQLCGHRDPLVRCWGNNHYAPGDFIVKKVAPYKPNNFFLFFKTRQSFHAVRAIDDTVPNKRYGMQFQLYEPANGLFKDLSEPDLIKPRLNL